MLGALPCALVVGRSWVMPSTVEAKFAHTQLLFDVSFLLKQRNKLPPPMTTMPGAALSKTLPSLHAWHKKQHLLFFAESSLWLQRWHCHKAARAVADLSTPGILPGQKAGVGDQWSHGRALLPSRAKILETNSCCSRISYLTYHTIRGLWY